MNALLTYTPHAQRTPLGAFPHVMPRVTEPTSRREQLFAAVRREQWAVGYRGEAWVGGKTIHGLTFFTADRGTPRARVLRFARRHLRGIYPAYDLNSFVASLVPEGKL